MKFQMACQEKYLDSLSYRKYIELLLFDEAWITHYLHETQYICEKQCRPKTKHRTHQTCI